MCPPQVAAFVAASLGALDVGGRAVLEVGSGDPHRVVRGIVAAHGPRRYVGVDLVPGPGVDA
ncbi:MAG TPA: hypothetical protein VE152_02070, partial [Acidimicrobiales bacterium]|nr:hypothetical protein [Acidimicrobiales bacterium]